MLDIELPRRLQPSTVPTQPVIVTGGARYTT